MVASPVMVAKHPNSRSQKDAGSCDLYNYALIMQKYVQIIKAGGLAYF